MLCAFVSVSVRGAAICERTGALLSKLQLLTPPPPVLFDAAGCQDGDGCDFADGGHGAVLRRTAGRHEAPLDRLGRPGMFRPFQRVPAQRFSQIVSQ